MAVFTLKSGGVTWHVRRKKKNNKAPRGVFVGPNQHDHTHELAQRSVNRLALAFFHKMGGVCYGGIPGFPYRTTDSFTLWYSSQRARRNFWACPIVILCGLAGCISSTTPAGSGSTANRKWGDSVWNRKSVISAKASGILKTVSIWEF